MERLPVIHDGDHGSDDFIATLMFAAHPDRFDLLGVTTGFGNVCASLSARNAGLALMLAERADLSVYKGGDTPFAGTAREGDAAFAEDGLGGMADAIRGYLAERKGHSPLPVCNAMSSVAWMAHTLEAAPRPVALCLTGLMTNAALLLRDYPHLKAKIKHIVLMGGCVGPLGPHKRYGNITPFAEFNFFMDADAAAFVLNVGLPVTVLPMDTTHKTVFTPDRQRALVKALPRPLGEILSRMMRAAEQYDCPKFALAGAALHDQNVPVYLLAPQLYQCTPVRIRIDTDKTSEQRGRMYITPDGGSPVALAKIADHNAVFDVILSSLRRLFEAPR